MFNPETLHTSVSVQGKLTLQARVFAYLEHHSIDIEYKHLDKLL
jgi:hypothetical protein